MIRCEILVVEEVIECRHDEWTRRIKTPINKLIEKFIKDNGITKENLISISDVTRVSATIVYDDEEKDKTEFDRLCERLRERTKDGKDKSDVPQKLSWEITDVLC